MAASALRSYLQKEGPVATITGPIWRDTFLKAQNAICYFAAGRKLTVIRKITEEAYPCPPKLRVAPLPKLAGKMMKKGVAS